MDPNQQQPNQIPPQPTPQPVSPPEPQQPVQPTPPSAQPQQYAQPSPNPAPQPGYPQTPSSYSTAPQPYDAHYLDSIAPPPPRPSFFSGAFGKIFFGLIGVFVLAVSLIVAFSGQDKTADLQQMFIRLENMQQTAKTVQKNIKSTNLSNINTTYQIWLTGSKTEAEDLLKKGGVKRTDYNKKMVADEKTLATDLDAKFEDARLSARLNRVYASTMSAETEKLLVMLKTMSKKSASPQIRDYAKNATTTLTQINKEFNDYVDDGN